MNMPETPRPFGCNRCMECCRRVNLLPETAAMDRGDGACRHLDEVRGACRIYENRPDICRVDRQYALHYQQAMTWEAFVKMNEAGCEKLQVLASRKKAL
ncbi:YkgJ family cysteine cluster protein [Pseudomonas viridiflava]|uniref:YkgJ family cysteine cluster protein n=2 Tax=Pseudomonas viridiflava TaxID=33069 RepID=UPI002ECCFBF1|nr:YkgJ family cysteine cluster protein [Pseudomonas viridiflava]